ncbi:hypothetical protein AVEN_107147-1 [Araneus ventricosus]|uniref:Uncharacterized protein n=1 Tax=Araneus ventricosus TaxID=182803 RepID=A0A4Y2I4C2_ARAVE|nr:hypothetical protein AVEN_107147-1 [Araneus ventricosus]
MGTILKSFHNIAIDVRESTGLVTLVRLTSTSMQHEGYFDTDLVILNNGKMTRETYKSAPPPPIFCMTIAGPNLNSTRPTYTVNLYGIGFRTRNISSLKPIPYHHATAASITSDEAVGIWWQTRV